MLVRCTSSRVSNHSFLKCSLFAGHIFRTVLAVSWFYLKNILPVGVHNLHDLTSLWIVQFVLILLGPLVQWSLQYHLIIIIPYPLSKISLIHGCLTATPALFFFLLGFLRPVALLVVAHLFSLQLHLGTSGEKHHELVVELHFVHVWYCHIFPIL